jgi:phosphoserine phosphatase
VDLLPSWRPGPARDAIGLFLESARSIPVAERVAYFDNDGTLWCERPSYPQLDFFLDELRRRASDDPSITDRPEFAALLGYDADAMADLGLERLAVALAGLFDGWDPEAFTAAVERFAEGFRHPRWGTPLDRLVYRPMLELMEALRAAEFTVGIVTGGGTEFVRAISNQLYGVAPELVVGTLIGYEFERRDGEPALRRSVELMGVANEGPAKVTAIQSQLGRCPLLAAGNSAGDAEMLEWATAGGLPGLALLLVHDDAEREYAYESRAASFDDDEPIGEKAERLGWVTVSMAKDWRTVFT